MWEVRDYERALKPRVFLQVSVCIKHRARASACTAGRLLEIQHAEGEFDDMDMGSQ